LVTRKFRLAKNFVESGQVKSYIIAMTGKNVALALGLSLAVSVVAAVGYAFYPLILVMVAGHEGTGIGSLGGDIWKSLLVIEPILFIAVLGLLEWQSGKR